MLLAEQDGHLEGSKGMSKPKKKPSSASTNQHFETRQRILPLKTGEYFMNKAQEVGARTTLELYQKAATLDMGAPFRVEDGSIRVHARRAKSKEDKVNSRWVTQNLGRGSL